MLDEKLLNETVWNNGIQKESYIAFRMIEIAGIKYLIIPEFYRLSQINDNMMLVEETKE